MKRQRNREIKRRDWRRVNERHYWWGGGAGQKKRVQPLYLNYQALLWQAYNCSHIGCQATLSAVRLMANQLASIAGTRRGLQAETGGGWHDSLWWLARFPCPPLSHERPGDHSVYAGGKVTWVDYVNSSASESCHHIIHEMASAWENRASLFLSHFLSPTLYGNIYVASDSKFFGEVLHLTYTSFNSNFVFLFL